ncbi:MAG: hypothetical protein WCJ49_09535 [Deltaproteobacteria bacterium]
MTFLLTDVQKVALAITPVDGAGNPAPVEGVIWSSTNPDVLAVVAAEDGLSAVATAVGPLGTAQVSVVADAQIGEGVVELTGVLDVQVVASQAVSLGVVAGIPEPK